MTINDFKNIPPMKYYDNPEPDTASAIQKRNDMLDNKNGQFIATEKRDGDWSMCIHYCKGKNLIRSRSISKITGEYGDYTPKVPHLVEEMDTWPDNTVVLAELCFAEYNTNCNTVGTILRCLPAKAIERQKTNPLYAYVFDILMYDGQDLTQLPYAKRIIDWAALVSVKYNNLTLSPNFFRRTVIFTGGIDFREAADEIIDAGGEGIVIQRCDNPYMPGTRTAWKTLKMKQRLPEMELTVIKALEPNKNYEGDFIDNWKYWQVDDIILTSNPSQQGHSLYETAGGADSMWKINGYSHRAITKPYFMGWKNGVVVDYNGVEVNVTSGLTDDDRAWLATTSAQSMIEKHELIAVVRAMSENELKSLRHPVFIRFRYPEEK